MSRIVASLVALAQAVGSATTFPHQPVPTSFRDRIAAAVKDVVEASGDPLVAGGEGSPTVDKEAVIAALLSDDGFAASVVEKLLDKKPPAALVTALTAKLGDQLSAAIAEFDKRFVALEAFAEKVDTDVAGRLTALEDAAKAGGE